MLAKMSIDRYKEEGRRTRKLELQKALQRDREKEIYKQSQKDLWNEYIKHRYKEIFNELMIDFKKKAP